MNRKFTFSPYHWVVALSFFSFCLPRHDLSAQNELLTIDDVFVLPGGANDLSNIQVYVSGFVQNECVYLDNHAIQVGDGFVLLSMDWAAGNLNCAPNPVFWDTVFNIGTLTADTYGLYFSGNRFVLEETVSIPTIFTVDNTSCQSNGADILVTNHLDEGPGSLRAAIDCANTIPGPNRIFFDWPGIGPDTIRVGATTGAPLPSLLDGNTIIDGTTHPAYGIGSGGPKVVLDGGYVDWDTPYNAIFVRANNCEIYGLEIINFPDDAIDVLGADRVIIGGVGKGNVIYNNGIEQDFFPGAPNQGPWDGAGIVLRNGADNAIVQGNIIGTNFQQTAVFGNEYVGIIAMNTGNNHQIGGRTPGTENIIVGHPIGVQVRPGSSRVSILQNRFYCNDSIPILLVGNANDSIAPPIIMDAASGAISGTGLPNQAIDVYLMATECNGTPCQGKTYLGSATVINGIWQLNYPFATGVPLQDGDVVTALAVDLTGNTSAFATCMAVEVNCQSTNGVISVTTANDDGAGSLREAINCANLLAGANTIVFDIPGNGPHVIRVGETTGLPLPTLLDAATTIDGTTQTGFGSDGPVVILDGSFTTWNLPYNAIWVQGDGCEIYGLEIRHFPDDGIDVTGANHVIIGDTGKGNVIYNCGLEQDIFPAASNPGPWEGCGIVLRNGSAECEIYDNIIGTDFNQNATIGNEFCGIIIRDGGDGHIIGKPGAGNVIAHQPTGIHVNTGSNFCKITQNRFFCNDTAAIDLFPNANGGLLPPVIGSISANLVTGSAPAGATAVEVFVNDATGCAGTICQGRVFIGTALVNNGIWELAAPFLSDIFPGAVLTATAISSLGNTSEFANCVAAAFCSLEVSSGSQTDATCGNDNGSVLVQVDGGVPPFTYTMGNVSSSDPLWPNLPGGMHLIAVEDAAGCVEVLEVTLEATSSPVIAIAELVHASCGQPNGSVSVIASGGIPPYTYQLDGIQQSVGNFGGLEPGLHIAEVTDVTGCMASLNIIVAAIPEMSIAFSEVTAPACEMNNGSFVVEVTDGTPPYTFDMGDGLRNDGNFTAIGAGNYSVVVTDGAGCSQELAFTLENEGELPVSSFIFILEENMLFVQNAATNADEYVWSFGDGNQSVEPDATHTYLEDGTYELCLNATNECGTDSYCELVNVVVPLATFSISGQVLRSDGVAISLVEMSCTDQTDRLNETDGAYGFADLPAANDYTITPYKNTGHKNGISLIDMIEVREHLLMQDTFGTPYQYIAADVNRSGTVSLLDMIYMREMLLFLRDTFPDNTAWRFVPSNHVFDYASQALDYNYDESIVVTNLLGDVVDADFVGVKIGDVNNTNNPATMSFQESIFEINDQSAMAGSILEVPVYLQSAQDLLGIQAVLGYDASMVAFVGMEETAGLIHIDHFNNHGDMVSMLWYPETRAEGFQMVELGSHLFTLKFEALQDIDALSEVMDFAINHPQETVGLDGQSRPIDWQWTTNALTDVSLLESKYDIDVYPNPFIAETLLGLDLPKQENVRLAIFDRLGRQVLVNEQVLSAGRHEWPINRTELNGNGVYFYVVEIGGERFEGKMVLLD